MAGEMYESGRHTVVADQRKWAGKPVLAFAVRSTVYVVPIAASILFSIWLSKRLPEPETAMQLMGWWLAIIGGSTGVLFVVDKAARRLLPLAALLQMTMIFPDRSPSRFRTAMRSGSSIRNLKAQIAVATEADRKGDASAAAEIILQLSSALNAHDPQTRGHSERVRAYTEMLAEELGVSEEDRAKLRWSSLLHDIGKLQIAAEILNKSGTLDDDEWLEIKRHPTYGIDLAGPLVQWLGEWAGAIEDHHERFDGFGYPNGRVGETISLGGRIVAVADAYDVMTTARSYKKPMPSSAAREELARHAGAQFDPEVVRAFLELAMGRLRWIAGPVSWLAQLPFLRFAGGVQSIGTTVGVAAAATTGAAAALAGGLIDIPNEVLALPPPPQALVDYQETPAVLSLAGDSFVVDENTNQRLNVLANDHLIDGSELAIIVDPGFGTVIVNADGTVTYVPDDDYTGTDTFTYEVTAPDGSTSTATVTITVQSVNGLPVLANDSVTVDEDGTVTIAVLANDSDAEGFDISTLALGTAPLNGRASIDGASIIYVPDPDFHGTDGFTYTVQDTDGELGLATVLVEVVPVNDLPVVPGPGALAVDDGASVSFDPLAGATDVDGDTLEMVAYDSTSAFGGTVAAGSLVYTSPINASGTDRFVYRVSDGTDTVAVTVSVSVNNVNYPPVFGGTSALTVDEDTAGTIDVLGPATDKDGDTLAVGTVDTTTTAGTVIDNGDGTITYTPPPDWAGTDRFAVEITDGENVVTVPITVTVIDVLEPPVLDPIEDVSADEGTPISFTATAIDPNGGLLTFSIDGAPTGATMTAGGDFSWTPNEVNGPGVYPFDVVVTDEDGEQDRGIATITVNEVNTAPVLQAVGNQALNEGDVKSVLLTAVDADVPANAMSFVVGGAPSFVALIDNGDGTGVLQMVPGFADTGNFPVTISVSDDGSPMLADTETIVISVGDVNLPPVVEDQTLAVAENSGPATVVGTVAASDPDAADALTYSITGPNPGFAISPASGTISVGSVALDFENTASYALAVRVTDNGTPGLSDTATVTINVANLNEAPQVADQSFVVLEESASGTAIGFVAATDEDAADSLTYTITGANPGFALDPAGGNLTVATIVLDYETTASYTITVDVTDDGAPVLNDTATITINVLDVLHPPVASDDGYATDRNTALVVAAPGVIGNDSDEDVDPLTVDTTPVALPTDGVVTLGADGSFTYTPDFGFVGTDTFEYQIDDGAAGTDTALVTIVVDDGVSASDLYLTASGSGTEFAFGTTPEPNVSPVPDYEGDGNPGFTIESSGGDLNENDPAKYQLWTLQPVAPLALNGPVTLELWSTVEDFQPDKDADLDLALFECAADGTDCNLLIEYHEHVEEWNLGVSDWVLRTFDLGAIAVTVVPTRRLEMKLMFGHEPVWVAMAGENPGEASRLLLTEANAGPAASDDSSTVGEDDGATAIGVLANDVDTNLDPVTVTVTGGAGAVRTGAPNPVTGEIPYTPAGSFDYLAAGVPATDTFTYQVCDTSAVCGGATVTVTVTGVNDGPVANHDGPGAGYTTDENSVFTTPPATANDFDVDDAFTVVAFDTVSASGGVVADGGGGQFDYDPNGQFDYLAQGESSTDTFTYTIEDGSGVQSTATVTVDVDGVNDDPVVFDQGFSVLENSAPTVAVGVVVASDADTGDTLSYTIIGPNPGFVIDPGTGNITVGSVVLDFEATSLYTLTVEVGDDSPSSGTDTAAITITVIDVAELPTANDDGPGVGFVTDQDTAFTTSNVFANDVDPDGFPLSVQSIDTSGTVGAISDNSDGTFGYDPNGAFDGLPGGTTATDTFTYTLEDSQGYTDTATVTIEVAGIDDAPVLAAIGNQNLSEGDTVTLPLSATDVDVPPNTLVFLSTPLPPFAGIIDNGDGTGWLSMTPGFSDEGNYPVTITVQETDGVPSNLSDAETFTITVGNVNRPPNPQDDSLLVVEDGSIFFTEASLLGNDTDPDGDAVLFDAITTSPVNGTITPLGGGSYRLDPAPAYAGADSFQYRVSDGSLFSTATVNVTVKPKEADLSVQILSAIPNPTVRAVDMTLRIEVRSAGPDPTGGTVVTIPLPAASTFVSATGGGCSGVAGPAVSCLVGNMVDGEVDAFDVTVTLGTAGNFNLVATVAASQSDPDLSDNTDSVNVTVLANLPPTVTALQSFAVAESAPNGAVVGTVAATDPDSTVQDFSIAGGDPAGVFAIDGAGQITVADGTTLDYESTTSYILSVTASDELTTSAVETVTVNVSDANDNAPVVDPSQVFSVSELSPVATSVGMVTATDADTTPITGFTITGGNGDGIFDIAASGQISVVDITNLDYETTTQYVLSVTASDGVNTSATETVTVDITDANDNAPVVDPSQVFNVAESAPNGTVVGTVAASDVDTTPVTGFAITAGNGAGIFGIDASGQITVVNRTNLDYETTTQHLLSVTAGDGVNTSVAETVTVDVTDVVEGAGLVVSEFRTVDVQFIELYNSSPAPSELTGLTVVVFPGTGSVVPSDVIPLPATTLLAYEHLLIGPAGLSPDVVRSVSIDQYGGIGVFNGPLFIDGVGTNGRPGGAADEAGSLLVEGTGLPPMVVAPGVAQSYERRHGNVASGGNCVDTGDNAADFVHNLGSANPQASGTADPCGAAPTAPASSALSVVISELRGDGPAGGTDDFVEIFNPRGVPAVMDGWTIGFHDTGWTTAYTFGTFTLDPGEHFLLTGPTYSGSVAGDASYAAALRNGGGVRIRNGASDVDLVGMGTSPAEGTALPAFAGRSDHSYERRGGGAWGSCVDSGNNLADFTHRFTSDPQNQASPATPCPGAAASPPVFSLASYSYLIARGSTVGTVVGTAPAFDPDPDTLSYAITSQFPAGQFSIDAAGEMRLALPLPDEIAVPPPYTATVRVDDGTGLFETAAVTFGLTDKVADLANAVAANPGLSILIGNEVSLTYTVTNDGPDQTPGTKIHHYYTPSEFSWNSGASSPGCSTGITGQVRCSFGTLFAAGSDVKTVVMRALELGTYSMSSHTFSGSSFDPDLSNNDTSVAVTVTTSTPGIDLALYVGDPNPLNPFTGTDFVLDWVVRNHGATTAPGGMVVTATLPAGVTFQFGSATNGPACTYAAPNVSCTITPAMTSGQNEPGSMTLRSSGSGPQSIVFTVSPIDALPANNSVSRLVNIL